MPEAEAVVAVHGDTIRLAPVDVEAQKKIPAEDALKILSSPEVDRQKNGPVYQMRVASKAGGVRYKVVTGNGMSVDANGRCVGVPYDRKPGVVEVSDNSGATARQEVDLR